MVAADPSTRLEGAEGFGRGYATADETARTNTHYDQPAEFFTTMTGGQWNTYSCNLWQSADEPDTFETQTASQERKLDYIAGLFDLRRGRRLLDVGSGWGGPLVYLADRHGVTGTGFSPSPSQQAWSTRRAQERSVDVSFEVSHWREFETDERFDAIFSDEVIVHFKDLQEFFEKARSLLRPGGLMINKELHWASTRLSTPTRAMVAINRSFGETGNYRLLHDELHLLDRAGFEVALIEQIPLWQYEQTLGTWVANLDRERDRLVALVGEDTYKRFRTYFRILRRGAREETMTLDVVVARPDRR